MCQQYCKSFCTCGVLADCRKYEALHHVAFYSVQTFCLCLFLPRLLSLLLPQLTGNATESSDVLLMGVCSQEHLREGGEISFLSSLSQAS